MPTEPAQREIKLDIALPQTGFAKCMFFNRFKVLKDSGLRIVHFGLDTEEGLLDHYCCLLSEEAMKQSQDNLLQYLGRSGGPPEKVAPWSKAVPPQRVDTVDVIGMACRNDLAETTLCAFSIVAATNMIKTHSENVRLDAQPLALLRSTYLLQRQLIVCLYEE